MSYKGYDLDATRSGGTWVIRIRHNEELITTVSDRDYNEELRKATDYVDWWCS